MANRIVELIKKSLKSNKLGQVLYPFLNKVYRLYSVPRRRRRLHNYGYEAMDLLYCIAQKEHIELFASYGTLLGFIREKDFISHDDDIDLGVLPYAGRDGEQLAKLLVDKYGLKFNHAFSYRGEITEICMEYKGIPVDFFFYTSDAERSWCYEYIWSPDSAYTDSRQNNVRQVYQARINKLIPIDVQGHRVMVPENAETFVESIYGLDWRCPDPTFSADDQQGNVDLDGFGYILSYDELVNHTFWKY